ncbi:membrane protein insertase YidC [Oxalobacter paraformigenes]|uniref:Membrane protein insertase YidC n=1 Tax=Oxalobacter paraformigenes TaxID=556268 RepID=C3X5V7_9BURK|nr:membrane protein insertase YidC [Oxalobacter paraformigenes]EEO28593.1 membrane protein insertase, YidC/Oxa1 family domain [Oxalobacter paraformigenes]
MDTKKRTTLLLILAISLFMLWDNWQVYRGGTSLIFQHEAKKTDSNVALPEVPVDTAVVPGEAGTPATPVAEVMKEAPKKQAELVTVTTDVLKVQINSEGGVFQNLELLKYPDNVDPEKDMILFESVPPRIYLAQTGLTGGVYPNHATRFTVHPGERSLADGKDEVKLVMDAERDGVRLTKTYTFKRGSYVVDVDQKVTNLTNEPIDASLYLQLLRDSSRPEGQSRFISTFTGPAVYTQADKFQKLKFDDITETKGADHATKADNGWIAIVQHYFVSAFIPKDKVERENYTKKVGEDLYAIGTVIPLGTIAPKASASNDSRLYAGPQESIILEQTAPGLELVKDYGWLTIIAKPIFWLMTHIHKEVGNWGWTIILLTCLIKLVFLPLSAASYKSMARMKQFTPRIQELRDRYKDDKQRMNQELMALYKAEKINPLGGCLPVVVQIPVFISLYWVLLASVEIRNAPWLGWIQNLAAPDPFYILPIIMAGSMFIQQKMSPPPPDPLQAKLMMFLPIVFSITFFFFPSGLVLYWVVNNLLSIAQQYWINKRYGNLPVKKTT